MFKFLFALFLLATAVFAQSADIGLPTYNQAVSAGSDLIVQVQRPVCPPALSSRPVLLITLFILFAFPEHLNGL